MPEGSLPLEATASMEVDVAFFDGSDHQKSDRVDGAIGELSPFHEMYGCYAAFAPRRCLKGGAAPGA